MRTSSSELGRNLSILKNGRNHLLIYDHSLFSNIPLPLPSMLVDNEVRSLSGTISEVNVEEEGDN